jgi:hypothetical protein
LIYHNGFTIIEKFKESRMGNPFYLQEVPVDAPFCNRRRELQELQSYAADGREAPAIVLLD